ncbi:MAG: DUF4349 domain-containing protein [Eubacterium sp.]|nr:DUF4349 domain-containing protein [Eubacterium sp.]
MKKRQMVQGLLAAGALAAALTGCGSSAGYSGSASTTYEAAADTAAHDGGNYSFNSADAPAEVAEEVVAEDYEYADAGEGGNVAKETQDALAGRKLIKNVNLNVETEQFDVLVPHLEQRVTAFGGYIEDMSSYSRNDNYSSDYVGTKYLRYASMTVRIPKENLDAFLEEVGEQSNIVSRSESVTDVTLQYVDLESHKKALHAEQDRLIELLGQAETVEDIITIEGRLSEVRYQLESMESQLRTFDNKIDYSTVYLSIDEVERYTPNEEVTTSERIKNGFLDSMKGVGRGISNFAIWFVVNLPYLVVWAVVIVLILLAVRLIGKAAAKRRAKKAAKRAKENPYPGQNPYQMQKSYQAQNPYPLQENDAVEQQGSADAIAQASDRQNGEQK